MRGSPRPVHEDFPIAIAAKERERLGVAPQTRQ
jgi:hypothetical protein